MKKRFLVTGMAEYYTYVEAESEEEAKQSSMTDDRIIWSRTFNLPLTDIKAVKADNEER